MGPKTRSLGQEGRRPDPVAEFIRILCPVLALDRWHQEETLGQSGRCAVSARLASRNLW